MRYVFILIIGIYAVVNGGNNTINWLGDSSTNSIRPAIIDSVTTTDAIGRLADSIVLIYQLPIPKEEVENWLRIMVHLESRTNTKAVNPKTGDSGLFQFASITRNDLGLTNVIEQPIEVQCHWYLKFLKRLGNKPYQIRTSGDLYALNYLPGRFNAPYLSKKRDKYYIRLLDRDNDGFVTKNDLTKYIQQNGIIHSKPSR